MQNHPDNAEDLFKRESSVSDLELSCRISLFLAACEEEEMNQIIAGAVELGACEIVPMVTDLSETVSDSEKERKIGRFNETASLEAAHARRTFIPRVKPFLTFEEAVETASGFDRKFIPYEMERGMQRTREEFDQIRPGDSVAVLIGPRAGFTIEEAARAKERGIVPVTLGHRVLRTKSAAIYVLSVLMYLTQQEW